MKNQTIKNVLLLVLLFISLQVRPTGYDEQESTSQSSQNDSDLPVAYFSTPPAEEATGDEYEEQATDEGPDGPPAPINKSVYFLFVLGIIYATKTYFYKTSKK